LEIFFELQMFESQTCERRKQLEGVQVDEVSEEQSITRQRRGVASQINGMVQIFVFEVLIGAGQLLDNIFIGCQGPRGATIL
jgi:hypothetical protein